jgi:hypothetical protein
MTLLGGSAVVITTQQSRARPAFLAVLIPLTLLEPALLIAFHQNLLQVVQVVDISMALLVCGLTTQLVLQQRLGPANFVPYIQAPTVAGPSAAQIEVSR